MALLIKRWMRPVAIAASVGLLACGCHCPKPTTPAVLVDTVLADTANLLAHLERLGDVAYDHPEQYIHDPDSFLNLLPALPTTTEGQEMYAWLLLNVGYALREAGNVLASARYYEQAMEYVDANGLREPDFVAYIAKPLGNLYTQIGDLQRAVHLHGRAIALARQRHDRQQLPALYTNLAVAYQQLGWPDSVLHACKSGLAFVDDRDVNATPIYNIMAQCYQELALLDTARHYNQLAIDRFSGKRPLGDTLIWYTSALHLACALDEKQDRLDQALQRIDQTIALTERHFPASKQRERAKYRYTRGNLRFISGDYAGAHQDFNQTLRLFGDSTVHAHFPDHTFTETLWGLARVHAQRQPDSAIHYYRRAIENAFHTQQLIVSDASHYQQSAWNRRLLADATEQLWAAYAHAGTPTHRQALAEQLCWITELSKGRQLLHEIRRTSQWAMDDQGSMRQQLQYLSQALATTQEPDEAQRLRNEMARLTFQFQLSEGHLEQSFAPPDFASFVGRMASLSDSAVLVSYFLSPSGDGYCVAFDRGSATAHRLAADSLGDIPAFIGRYFGTSPAVYENDPGSYATEAHRWAAMLLPTLPDDANRRVTLSPDGVLLNLPFDALVHQGRFLAESHTINHTYTFLLTAAPPSAAIDRDQSLHVFAKSRYGGNGLRDLPFVETEAAYLGEAFGATVYQDEAATDTAFFRALGAGGPIHIAAHAIVDGPGGPFIAFDRPVTLGNLHYVRATAPLVFLSACQTASGQLLPGEGVESLNKAFLSKGVQGVIASYWTVDDETTAGLAQSFYDALARVGRPSLALAEAKRAHIASRLASARNPWYWASLQFTGLDAQIGLQRPSRWRRGLYLGLALAAIGCTGWLVLRRPKRPFQRKHQETD